MLICLCNFTAYGKSVQKVPFYISNHRAVIEQYIVLKVMIKTPVIQIGCANGRNDTITYALFGMTEARSIFKNPHTAANQPTIIRAGHGIHGLLVRHTGGNYPHVHTPFCSQP
jgi:hypothetical protein